MDGYLKGKTIKELRDLAIEFNLKIPKNDTKTEIILNIINFFDKHPTYKKIKKLGNTGKDGIVYLVEGKNCKKYAMKTFKQTKSLKKIELEYDLQKQASKYMISPRVKELNLEDKYIVMEKLDKHLTDVIETQKGNLTIKQQERLIDIYNKLDVCRVFHGDSNILNYMISDDNIIYIIDFGMSKPIDDKLKKTLKTDTPNLTLMTLGFVLKLKENNCPPSSYKYLLNYISNENKIKFRLV